MDNERKSLPMVALRGMTIMPEMVVHFDVSRERSIAAIQEAMVEEQKIFLAAQKSIETEDPGQEDVYDVRYGRHDQTADQASEAYRACPGFGENRGILRRIEQKDPYLRAEVEVIDESGLVIPDDPKNQAMERSLKDNVCGICVEERQDVKRSGGAAG